jgi:hypothetical protein
MFQNRKISYFLIALMMCGGGETNSSTTVNTETIGSGLFFAGGLTSLVTMFTSYFLCDGGLNYAEKSSLTTGNATGAAACRAGRVAIEQAILKVSFGTVLASLPFIYLPNREITLYSKPEEKKFDSMDEAKLTCSFAIAKSRAQQNQLNSEVCWACDKKTGIILPDFVAQELNPQLKESDKIQKQFLIARWLIRQSNTTPSSRINTNISQIAELMSKPELWTDPTVAAVLGNLGEIYSEKNLQDYKENDTKLTAWNETISLLKTWPQKLDLETGLKDKLSWLTSDVISIEAKRAMIRALLTKIRLQTQNKLDQARYTQLTGYSFESWQTYLKESFTNSKELKNDTKQDGYLDQVITLFLLFVRNILGIEGKAVGRQRDSEVGSTEYNKDITLGYGSTGYSKQDNDGRVEFVNAVKTKLEELLSKNTTSVIQDTDTPQISFQINQKEVYYLAELANAFYQFMSAEMDKSKTGDGALNETQLNEATTKGSYIQRQEEYNLGYLRQWFVRTRSIHPIISWLFQNYNPHMSQKISLSAAYWYSYSFMSDWINFYGGETIKRSVGEFLDPIFNKLGKGLREQIEPLMKSWLESTRTIPS